MSDKPSKSALKRRYHELQALGEALINLPAEQLLRIPLDEDLQEAIRTASGMKAHGALRRQKQLIGKLMRNVDDQPIRAALEAATRPALQSNEQFHLAEQWRDRIVATGREAVGSFPASDEATKAALTELADQLQRCRHDADRRQLGRRIFRVVYSALQPKVHNTASKR